MEIRDFDTADEAAVVALWNACGLAVPWNDPADDIRRCMAGPSSTLLVGIAEDELVATTMVGHDGHRGWIYYVAVRPELQGRGLGREMVDAAEAWLAARGVPKLLLMVRQGNDRVVPFYARLGYVEEPRILMSKRLGEPSAG